MFKKYWKTLRLAEEGKRSGEYCNLNGFYLRLYNGADSSERWHEILGNSDAGLLSCGIIQFPELN